ncbi:MAG: hypothetical protein KFF77_09960 [Bacteroidetes bacterium]|nr:hypothetical protein [Bacteroidota bacterium]
MTGFRFLPFHIIIIAILATPAFTHAQWLLRLDGGLVQAGGEVEPSSENLEHAARGGLSLGAAVEYAFPTGISLSLEAAWREGGVERYFRQQLVEEHRHRRIDAAAVLRWMPLRGRLRPHLLTGAGFTVPLETMVQFGFHERFNFIEGTEGMRTAVPFVLIGGGVRLSFDSGILLGAEAAWQPALADTYAASTPGGPSFLARDVLVIVSVGYTWGFGHFR